ncbi:MAG: transcription termination/antitermination protein NusG [bacterium]
MRVVSVFAVSSFAAHTAPPWFALRVRSNFEKVASEALRQAGYVQFLPVFRSTRRWSGRDRQVELPVFPGYLFARSEPERLQSLASLRGVLHVVSAGRTPVPVDESEIAAVEAIARSALTAHPWPFLNAGRRVIIDHGPLAGFSGILVQTRNQHWLVVSVSLLMRSIAVDVPAEWVRQSGSPLRASATVPRNLGREVRAAGLSTPGGPLCSRKNDEAV